MPFPLPEAFAFRSPCLSMLLNNNSFIYWCYYVKEKWCLHQEVLQWSKLPVNCIMLSQKIGWMLKFATRTISTIWDCCILKADDLAKPDGFLCTLCPSESWLQSDTREATWEGRTEHRMTQRPSPTICYQKYHDCGASTNLYLALFSSEKTFSIDHASVRKEKSKPTKFAVPFASCLLNCSQTSCHVGPGALAYLSPSITKFPVFFLTTYVIFSFSLRCSLSDLTIPKQPWARYAWSTWPEDFLPRYNKPYLSAKRRERDSM